MCAHHCLFNGDNDCALYGLDSNKCQHFGGVRLPCNAADATDQKKSKYDVMTGIHVVMIIKIV